MKRKIAFLAIIFGVLILLLTGYTVFIRRSPKTGVLKVQSSPAASIFLENKHIGRTPYEDKVPVGTYTIKIVPESSTSPLAAWQGKITVSPNLLTYVQRDLSESELASAGETLWLERISSKKSEIAITTVPDGASVFLDEESKGVTPIVLQDVAPGDHTLAVTSPGFVTRSLKIKSTGGYKVNAIVQLALSSVVPSPTPVASPAATVEETIDTIPTPIPNGKTTPTSSPKITPTPSKTASPSASVKIPAKPYVTIKETGLGYLKVRQEASTASTELARVNTGEKFTYIDSQKDTQSRTWYNIKYQEEKTGWVLGEYVEVTQ